MKTVLKLDAIIFLAIIGFFLARGFPTGAQHAEVVRKAQRMADVHQTTRAARNLSADEVVDLEKQLAKKPDDTMLRTKLIGYYGDYREWRDRPRRQKYQEHVLWLISNDPTAAVLGTPFGHLDPHRDRDAYSDGKKAWLEQIDRGSDDINTLRNAVHFFTLHDRDIAIKLTKKTEALEPNNPDWPKKLGHLYELNMRGYNSVDPEAATQAVEAYQRALKLAHRESARASIMQSLAKSAFAAEQYEIAKQYATTLVTEMAIGHSKETSIHHGNTVLGRIAIKDGDVDAAKKHLLASGRIEGSPTLSSFGPSMALANELLENEEWDVVVEYFDLCAKFWKHARSLKQLDEWKVLVQAKRIPDFRMNLNR